MTLIRAVLLASAVTFTVPSVASAKCSKTFTIKTFQRAADRAYAGTRSPTHRDIVQLVRIRRCQRTPWGAKFTLGVWARARAANATRKRATLSTCPPLSCSEASWYQDAGATASGYHAFYGVAHKTMTFGTHVRICIPGGSCVVATVDDRGPYVGAREWDLNQNTAGALGFGGVGTVAWEIVR